MKRSIFHRSARVFVEKGKPVMRAFLQIFFDREFIRGRHFEESLAGYLWGFHSVWTRNILRLGAPTPFPISYKARISRPDNIEFHVDDLNNFQSPGLYLQNFSGHIRLGRGTYLAPNVGIITANHDPLNLEHHIGAKDVEIGERCWIGMNSVVLPGVTLGPNTIVGAGSVVTKSFPEGHCIIGGNPARLIREISLGNLLS